MTDSEKADIERVDKAVAELSEQWENVQIFCSRRERGETFKFARGSGNWFARFGHVREWLIREEETSKAEARKMIEKEDTDGDDD